ncbi:MAG: hypothetical protein ACE5GO_03800, partial [Anaerolineales bacterium]
ITLAPGTALPQTWNVIGRPGSVTVVLEGEDALPADDAASVGLHPAQGKPGESVSVALVAGEPGPLERALEAVPNTELQIIKPEDYLPGSPLDLVVFRRYLPDRWPGGCVLVTAPPEKSSLLGTAKIVKISTLPFPNPDPLLVDVDFTGVRWTNVWELRSVPKGFDPILQAGSLPLILRGQVGIAQITLLLPEIATENGTPTPFARHPAFPVLIANVVEMCGLAFPDQIQTGDTLPLPAPDQYPAVRILPPGGDPLEYTAARPPAWGDTLDPGLYRIEPVDPDGVTSAFSLGVNAGDLDESDIAPGQFSVDSGQSSGGSAMTGQPVLLLPYLLALAALLLLLEAWLAWR